MHRFMKIATAILAALGVLGAAAGMFGIFDAIRGGYTFRTSAETVVQELRALARLETAQFTIEKVIDAGTSGGANLLSEILFGDKILLIAHGYAIAGFDLSRLHEGSVEVRGETVTITLPPPQILLVRLDNEATRVYDRRQGLLTKGDKDLEAKARAYAENEIKKAACNGGILREASIGAQKELGTLFRTLGFTEVLIHIPEGNCS